MTCGKPEILAPAGSMESLIAALRTGADAVYIGGKNFSARSSAANFSDDEIEKAAELCRLYGAKLYLAVNTVIFDEETADFCEYIKKTAEIGIDAFIVQDVGAARLIKKCVPDAVLHASTQMSVHTALGTKLLEKLGFSRVVPARELDRKALERIINTGIQTEIFVHGALCMSVSGQCYMSAMIGTRSANRGKCGQACRLPFSSCGKKNVFSLSLKDLSLIPNASQLLEIGADSLKIEGRMKRPEYVASAVNALVDSLDGKAPDMKLLRCIFSRGGFTDGYFAGKLTDMFGIREKNDVVSAEKYFPKIHELYRKERAARIVNFHAVIKSGEPVRISASCCGLTETVISQPPETAVNRPTDIDTLKKQLSRLGDTVFSMGDVTAEISGNPAVPAGKLNEIRRTLAEKLSARIISELKPSYTITKYNPIIGKAEKSHGNNNKSAKLPIRTFCRTAEQAEAAAPASEFVVIPHELILKEKCGNIPVECVIVSPPRFIADEEKLTHELSAIHSKGYTHLMCHTLDGIAVGKEIGFKLHGSFTLNICNSFSTDFLYNLGLEDFIISFEADISRISTISAALPMGAVICGRLPLMLTRNCPVKNEVGCRNCTGSLTDRTGRKFPVVCSGSYAEILNSDILYMFDKPNFLSLIDFGCILLNDENREQTIKIISGKKPDFGITRGLYYRGI